jgi:hypothetical protein
MVSTHRGSTYRDGRFRHWIKVKNRQHPVQQGSGSVLKQRAHWRMRRFEVPEDNGFIAECVRLLGLRIRHQRHSLIVFQPEHIVETATRLGRERRRRGG